MLGYTHAAGFLTMGSFC